MSAGARNADVPIWKREVPTAPPVDMEEFLRSPPEPPRSCPDGSSLWLLGYKLDDWCADEFARSLMAGWKMAGSSA